MSDFIGIKTVEPSARMMHIPSDTLSLAAYAEFKTKFNAELSKKNARIKAANAKLHESQKPENELEPFPMETIPMISERIFIITMEGFRRIVIPKGIFNCPVELADHWYIEANGVTRFKSPDMPQLVKEEQPDNIASKFKGKK